MPENDNAPKFINSTLSALIGPYHAAGAYVTAVLASDADAGGKDGDIAYNLLYPEKFKIDTATGSIFALVELNFTIGDQFVIGVECSDGGIPTRTTVAEIQVEVVENPNIPRWETQFYSLEMPYDSLQRGFEKRIQIKGRQCN